MQDAFGKPKLIIRNRYGRRNTISLVLLKLIIILLCMAQRCILSNCVAIDQHHSTVRQGD